MFTNTINDRISQQTKRRIHIRPIRSAAARALEQLESRTLLSSTLFVTDASVATDATHFHTLQSALAFAVAGDSVVLQPGFSAGIFNNTALSTNAVAGSNSIHTTLALDVGEVISIGNGGADTVERALVTAVTPLLSGDFMITLANNLAFNHSGSAVKAGDSPTIGINKGIMLSANPPGVAVPFNLEIWTNTTGVQLSKLQLGSNGLFVDAGANNNTFSTSTFGQVTLAAGSHQNTLDSNTIGNLTAIGTGNANGQDSYNANTFTGQVVITGNDSLENGDAITNNTFTTSSGDALTLNSLSGTLVQHNTFTNSGVGARSLVIHNSDDITLTGNTITPTGTGNVGLYIYADGTGSTSVDVTGNTIHTGTGTAVSLAKLTTTASLEVRLQSDNISMNAKGVVITGDGTSAGNIDLGGDTDTPTRFDASIGDNDFTSYTTADATHFAIGIFNTSPAYTVLAIGNHFTPADPTTVITDSTHNAPANGTGVVAFANIVQPSEMLTATVNDLAAIQTGTTTGVIASFSSNLPRTAGDFTVSIDWGDGTTSLGMVVANNSGGFDVVASHTWAKSGDFNFSLVVTTPDTQGTFGATASVTPRLLVAVGKDFSALKKNSFNGVIATFTDNVHGTTATLYKSTITWSDGLTTAGTITKNADGSFSVKTSRTFKAAGAYIATITVSTVDGLFLATATAKGTVTNGDGKCHHIVKHVFHIVMCCIHSNHGKAPAPTHGACHH